MGQIVVCDLCGKPLECNDSHYKVKQLKGLWHEWWWERIDVHDECVKKLFENIKKEGDPNV